MANCDYCGATILFGGKSEGELRFCNEQCYRGGFLLSVSHQIPEDLVRQRVHSVHQGLCPRCHGAGPVDIHTSYWIWSALVMTSWKNTLQMSCRRCGRESQLKALGVSLVAGWWGIPWGFVMTPVQLVRNLIALSREADPYRPSAELEKAVRLALAQAVLVEQQPLGTAP